jgi:DNA repair exonuclease SbcCD ATPase subunit
VLVLDEPTNHLDLEAIEALVAALQRYDGTLVFVSHDRWFVSQLANRIVEIAPEGLRTFEGSYEEYVQKCGDDHLDVESVALRVKRQKGRKKASEGSPIPVPEHRLRRELEASRDRLEREIEGLEARVQAIDERFCDPAYFDRTALAEVRELEGEQKRLKVEIEGRMKDWESVENDLARIGAPEGLSRGPRVRVSPSTTDEPERKHGPRRSPRG